MEKIKRIEFITYILVLLSVGIIGIINFLIDNRNLNIHLDESLKQKSNIIENFFQNSVKEATTIYDKKVETLLGKEKIIEAFDKRDREALYRLVLPEYEILKRENPYMEVLHFHLPNNHSFLRMHNPKKFGDDLSSFRHAVVDTNKKRLKNDGFETGIYGVFQRFIHPVFNKKGEHIGSLEIGLFVDHFIDKARYVLPDSELIVLINKSELIDKRKAQYNIALQTDNYVVLENYKNDFFDQEMLNSFEKNDVSVQEIDERFFIPVNTLDFYTFERKAISKIGIFMNVNNEVIEHQKQVKKSLIVLVVLIAVIFILLSIIFYIFNKKLSAQYKEISEKDKDLNELNKNLSNQVKEQIEKIREQEQVLFHQSKMAMMGEMMNAIAHQWRQPLNVMALQIQDIEDAYKFNEIDEAYIKRITGDSMKQINYLSDTIDNFKNFFRQDEIKKEFNIQEALNEVKSMLETQFAEHRIDIAITGSDFKIEGYRNELNQILLNILNNSKDAISNIQKENPLYTGLITIETTITQDTKRIVIEDNGGGIEDTIIKRVFEPYFTTKFQTQGTGMGLFVSKMIIEKHHSGRIAVTNIHDGLRVAIDLA